MDGAVDEAAKLPLFIGLILQVFPEMVSLAEQRQGADDG